MMLRNTATQLVKGTISLQAAGEAAQDAILGVRGASSHLPGRVLRGTAEVGKDIADLGAYIEEHPIEHPEKWAGTFIMLHVQLAIRAVPEAVRMTKSVIQVSRASCPKSAKAYAMAIVDTVLAQAEDLTPAEAELFREARRSFAQL